MKAVRRVCVCVVHHRLGGSLPAQAKEEEEEEVVGGAKKRATFLCAVYIGETTFCLFCCRRQSHHPSGVRRS